MIYIITFTHIGIKESDEDDGTRRHYFPESKKGDFIKEYLRLREEWYATDLRVFRARPEEINIDDILNQL